jgi:hypothetical protein
VDWIGLAQERGSWRALVNLALNLRFPLNAGKTGLNNQVVKIKAISCSGVLWRIGIVKYLPVVYNFEILQYEIEVYASKT